MVVGLVVVPFADMENAKRSSLGTKMLCLFWVSRVLDTHSIHTGKCLIGTGYKGLEVKEESLAVVEI